MPRSLLGCVRCVFSLDHQLAFPLVALTLCLAGCTTPGMKPGPQDLPELDPGTRLNQIQVIGTHNSYKHAIEPELLDRMLALSPQAKALDYAHLPLTDQLNLGVRALEIDVYNDPEGGRYAHPLGPRLLRAGGITPEPWPGPDEAPDVLTRPGFKVMHDADFDFRADQVDFAESLRVLRTWSLAHPGHLCIVVTMNLKDDKNDTPGCVTPAPFDRASLDRLDQALLTHLGRDRLLTPDDVRGSLPTLVQAITTHGWPTLSQSRGKFLFVMDETGQKQRDYLDEHPSLKDRVLFVDAAPARPEAAVCIMNEPERDADSIRSLVKAGYLVRTRADAGTTEARAGSLARAATALATGAQVVSTDYPIPDRRIHPTYRVRFPDGTLVRPNPVIPPTRTGNTAQPGADSHPAAASR